MDAPRKKSLATARRPSAPRAKPAAAIAALPNASTGAAAAVPPAPKLWLNTCLSFAKDAGGPTKPRLALRFAPRTRPARRLSPNYPHPNPSPTWRPGSGFPKADCTVSPKCSTPKVTRVARAICVSQRITSMSLSRILRRQHPQPTYADHRIGVRPRKRRAGQSCRSRRAGSRHRPCSRRHLDGGLEYRASTYPFGLPLTQRVHRPSFLPVACPG
jgi:hypothetical protein